MFLSSWLESFKETVRPSRRAPGQSRSRNRRRLPPQVLEFLEQRVVLTSHGRPVAVVDSAERLDESARLIREASLAVLDAAADLVSARGKKFSLDEVCTRVGVDAGRVRELAAERSATNR